MEHKVSLYDIFSMLDFKDDYHFFSENYKKLFNDCNYYISEMNNLVISLNLLWEDLAEKVYKDNYDRVKNLNPDGDNIENNSWLREMFEDAMNTTGIKIRIDIDIMNYFLDKTEEIIKKIIPRVSLITTHECYHDWERMDDDHVKYIMDECSELAYFLRERLNLIYSFKEMIKKDKVDYVYTKYEGIVDNVNAMKLSEYMVPVFIDYKPDKNIVGDDIINKLSNTDIENIDTDTLYGTIASTKFKFLQP